MKKLVFLMLAPVVAWAFQPVQNDVKYQLHINLTEIKDDMVKVEMVPPVLEKDTVIFNMPKIVPGTYSIYNFGQFVNDFKATDSRGEALKFEQINENQWQIFDAKNLYKIEYWSSASMNQEKSPIFAPAGSHISEEVFLMNNFSFFGYLQSHKHTPYEFSVKKPAALFGVTSLHATSRTDTMDVFEVSGYFELHDSPILYAKPDTASTQVAGIPVTIGVYSSEGNIDAKSVLAELKPVFESAADYLGGNLPAEQYNVLIYGLAPRKAIRGTGALEHHTSTVMTVPDASPEVMKLFGQSANQLYRDIVAHEFFHIVTPLNIHAKQINDFDFINPQMSEHLWLYEGITEYNAMISQARGGVLSLEEFIDMTKEKLEYSRIYNENVPFTVMSEYALGFYKGEYGNVYQKGALIGMTLDLKLRTLSDGEMGLIDLLEKLWTVYDADTFFVDNQLFDIIAQNSYPEIKEFLVRHVQAAEPLPLAELLAEVGIDYKAEVEKEQITVGKLGTFPSKEHGGMQVNSFDAEHPFTKELGLQKGDVIVAWNDAEITPHTFAKVISEYKTNAEEGDKVRVKVMRKKDDEKWEEVKLKAHAVRQNVILQDVFSINENLTDYQRNLRKLWINY